MQLADFVESEFLTEQVNFNIYNAFFCLKGVMYEVNICTI